MWTSPTDTVERRRGKDSVGEVNGFLEGAEGK